MKRAYFLVAYGLVIAASVMLLALWFGAPRESAANDGWRELERVDSV